MPEKITFTAQPRTLMGKKVSKLRRDSLVPANISGDVEKVVPVSVEKTAFAKLYDRVGDTGLFYLKVEGESSDRPVLISEVQAHPVSADVLHVVFRQVDLSEKVSAEVPVEVVGELAVKEALVVTVHDAIEVEALPQDLPEKFVIDAAQFTEVGQMVTFNQLSYDRNKVSLKVEGEELETPVVMVQAVKAEAEVEAPVATEGEAAPAEGAEAAGATAPTAEEKKE